MPSRSEKKSEGWLQSLKKRCLRLSKEWPKNPWFMRFYFIMLFLILVILAISFVPFMIRDVSNGNGMEVTIGITVGMFGILATFAVVFFAFRAEETAVSTATEVARKFSKQAFFDEEKETFKVLQHHVEYQKPYFDPNNAKKEKIDIDDGDDDIDKGIDTSWWQLFAWNAVISLVLILPFWLYFFLLEIPPKGSDWNGGLKLQILTLWVIGMLGILITFTVVLFATRVAQLSQIAGRIESHSVIEKLAVSEEKLYHEQFEMIDKVYGHVKDNLISTQLARFKLLKDSRQNLNREQIEKFQKLVDERIPPSNAFSCAIASVAFIIICLIGVDMLRGDAAIIDSISGIISSSAILFAFLIFSISVFFLGRVFRSAITSSREVAIKASYFEFDQKRTDLENRIKAFREIKKNKALLDKLPTKEFSFKASRKTIMENTSLMQIANIVVSILMHLRHLKKILPEQNQKERGYYYFDKICKEPKRWFADNCNFLGQLLELTRRITKEDMDQSMKRARELDECVLNFIKKRTQPKQEDYVGREDDYENRKKFHSLELAIYRPKDFLDCEKAMKNKEEWKNYLTARNEARNKLLELLFQAKLCIMILLFHGGLQVLEGDIMVPVKDKDARGTNAERAPETDYNSLLSLKLAKKTMVFDILSDIIPNPLDEKHTGPVHALDMGGSVPIFTSEIIETLHGAEKLWKGLERIFPHAENKILTS